MTLQQQLHPLSCSTPLHAFGAHFTGLEAPSDAHALSDLCSSR